MENKKESESWIDKFKKSWKEYNIEEHQNTYGSKKQIQRSNFSKRNKR